MAGTENHARSAHGTERTNWINMEDEMFLGRFGFQRLEPFAEGFQIMAQLVMRIVETAGIRKTVIKFDR